MKAFIFTLCAALLATAAAMPRPSKRLVQLTGKPFEITNLVVRDVSAGNTSVSFNVHDPDPLTNATAFCGAAWAHETDGYPSGSYALCTPRNTSFAWNMFSYTDTHNFTLQVEHDFEDPSVGKPPYDQVTTFAKAPINSSTLACDVMGGTVTCRQQKGTVIKAPIYAVSA